MEKASVTTAIDVLDDKVEAGENVVVVGGGLIGSETGIYLADKGHKVTIVEMLPQIMKDVSAADVTVYSGKIKDDGIDVLSNT